MTELSGQCLCGSARLQAQGEVIVAGDCYCVDCRKSSGSAHCTHIAMPDADFIVHGPVTRYPHGTDSGNIVTRAFCPSCGSALYSTNSGMPGMVFMRASCLDDPNAITPQMSVYTSRAPHWARLIPDAPAFAEMPPPQDMPID